MRLPWCHGWQVVQSTPLSFLPINFFPVTPTDAPFVGLPVIDGVTLVRPLEAALEAGLVDVPLLVQNMRDEDDAFANSTKAVCACRVMCAPRA